MHPKSICTCLPPKLPLVSIPIDKKLVVRMTRKIDPLVSSAVITRLLIPSELAECTISIRFRFVTA